jgi:hypothetical protein
MISTELPSAAGGKARPSKKFRQSLVRGTPFACQPLFHHCLPASVRLVTDTCFRSLCFKTIAPSPPPLVLSPSEHGAPFTTCSPLREDVLRPSRKVSRPQHSHLRSCARLYSSLQSPHEHPYLDSRLSPTPHSTRASNGDRLQPRKQRKRTQHTTNL